MTMQSTLEANQYKIKMDLVTEGARRRLMMGNQDHIN